MKKNIYSVIALAGALTLNAQIFSAGFENNNGTPLSEFKTVNADGNQVPFYAQVQDFNTEAWIQFYDGFDNKIAFSTSFYDPSGQSEDWLITPAIPIPATGSPTLYWKAKSYDFDFTDSYVIKVSETDDNPDSFTTTLETVENEQPYDFAAHSLNLSAYKGKTIHLAIVNNTYDGTYLAVDDFYISNSAGCIMPETGGIQISALKPNSFSAQWNATDGITSYDTGLTTFTVPVTSGGITTATAKDFSGLQPATRYQLFLKNADCGSGWAGPKSIWTPSILPYSYDFEKTTENFGEYDSDGWSSNTWLNGESDTAAHSGTGYVYNNTSSSFAKNDWLFSYPVYLLAGEKIDIQYFTALSLEEADAATLKIAVASAPDKDNIVASLSSEQIQGTAYQEKTAEFTAETEGVHYIGFGNVTPVVENTASLRLDKVSIQKSSLGVAETVKNEVSVYPNPVKDILQIKTDQKIRKTEIYSASGQLLNTFSTDTVNFSAYPKGVYLVKIYTEKGITTKKVVK